MTCLDTALLLNSMGMVPVLIPPGKKAPLGKAWHTKRYSDDELRERFDNNPEMNLGVLLGPESKVVAIDRDSPEAVADLAELFGGEIPPTPGWASKRGGQDMFAWDARLAALGVAVFKWKSLEIRIGAGGKAAQSVVPPSTTDGFTRKWTKTLSPDFPPAKLPESVIQKLLESVKKPKPAEKPKPRHPVADDFIRTSDWNFIKDHGWTINGDYATRPGTDKPVSASFVTAQDGTRLLHVFSVNAQPFEPDCNYNAYDAFRLLNHNGDHEAACNALVKLGFGRMQIPLITSAELDSGNYEITYLIDDTLVKDQPCILAGGKKSGKTTIAIDLAISLATCKPFLGRFEVSKPCKVVMLSGESGLGTIQETARRICKSKRVQLPSITSLDWSPFLPTFTDAVHMDALERMLQEIKCEVLILDPAYLCMPGVDAGNLFVQGQMLRKVADICQPHGVTLVLIHHTRKQGKDKRKADYEPPELDDMSWAGFAEFARQWILIGRRTPYEPGTGHHELWLSIGGSAGHSALHAVDIDEGIVGKPRHWEVSLLTPANARENKKSNKIRERLIDAAKQFPNGESKTGLFKTSKLKSDAATRTVFDALVSEGVLVPCKIKKNSQEQNAYQLAL
ncbi:MAG: AAA family ATPase [Thermoguttaceae bacterium]